MMGNSTTGSPEFCRTFYAYFQPSLSSAGFITACIVNLTFGFGGTFLNSLVIFTFMSSSFLRKKVCYFLIMVLSSVDLIVVVIVHPLAIFFSVSLFTRKNICMSGKLYSYSISLLCGLSGYTLLAMNIERYLAIVHPFFYQGTVTKWKLLLLVGLFWTIIVALLLFSILFPFMKGIVIVAEVLLFLLISTFVYVKILIIARKKRRESAIEHERSGEQVRQYKNHMRDVKLTAEYILIVLCFFICYSPTGLANGMDYLALNPGSQSAALFGKFRIWTRIIMIMNSTFNCLIFFWKNKTLCRESRKLLKCF